MKRGLNWRGLAASVITHIPYVSPAVVLLTQISDGLQFRIGCDGSAQSGS